MSGSPSRRGLRWPIAVAAILAATVGANIYVAVLANDDPSFAIEPNYYQRAIHWDDEMAQARRNDALGWHLAPTLAPIAGGRALLVVRLTDAGGATIQDAAIRVAAFHNARAGDVRDADLHPRGDGSYAAAIAMQRAGQWELHFQATRGSDRFTALERVEATLAPGATSLAVR
jgi:nitrogen fixation protein FixH